jgi:hypothetical protein
VSYRIWCHTSREDARVGRQQVAARGVFSIVAPRSAWMRGCPGRAARKASVAAPPLSGKAAMRMHRIAVSSLALLMSGSCVTPARPADDAQALPPAEPAAEANASALLQDEAPPVSADSAAGTQPAGQQVQPGSAGQASSVYPLLWDQHQVQGPPPLTVPVQAQPAPASADPVLVEAQPAPLSAQPALVQAQQPGHR